MQRGLNWTLRGHEKAPLGCGEKEFRCRLETRQPEAFLRHQSPVSAELVLPEARESIV